MELEMGLDGWQVLGLFALAVLLFTIWTTISTRRGMRPVGPAASLEAQAGRGVVEGTIGCLGLLLGLVMLVGGVYVLVRRPTIIPGVRVQWAMPTPTPVIEGRLRPGLRVEVVAPGEVYMYAANGMGMPAADVMPQPVRNPTLGIISGGPVACGEGAMCWRVHLADGREGWLVERLPQGQRVLAAAP